MGTQLGYKDEQLHEFVKQQQTSEREERHRKGKLRAREAERDTKREARAAQHEREREECHGEPQERLVRMRGEQELEKLRLEAQLRAETGSMRNGFGVETLWQVESDLSYQEAA